MRLATSNLFIFGREISSASGRYMVTIFVSVSKPAPSWVTSLATIMSADFRASLPRAFSATLFVSAAKPTTTRWPFSLPSSARMSGVGSKVSVNPPSSRFIFVFGGPSWPIIGNRRRHHHDVRFRRAFTHRLMHLFSRPHRHPVRTFRNFQIRRPANKNYPRAAPLRRFRQRISHLPRRAVGQKTYRVDILTSRPSGDQNRLPVQIVPQSQHVPNFQHNRVRRRQPPCADHPARQISFVRRDDMNAARAQRRQIFLRRRVLPHIHVHRGSDHDRRLRSQIKCGKKIPSQPLRKFRQAVSSRRRDQQQIDALRHRNMLNRAFDVRRRSILRAKNFGDDFLPGQCSKGKRGDEFLGRAGHHGLHVQLFLLQAPHQFGGFVRRHSSGDPQRDFHAALAATYAFRFFSSLSSASSIRFGASYSSSPFCSSSSAMRVVFRDFGLSTIARPPINNWRARRATTTTYANWLSGASLRCAICKSASKRLQNFANAVFVSGYPAARPHRDCLDFPACSFEIIVNYRKIVAAVAQHFLTRTAQPP